MYIDADRTPQYELLEQFYCNVNRAYRAIISFPSKQTSGNKKEITDYLGARSAIMDFPFSCSYSY